MDERQKRKSDVPADEIPELAQALRLRHLRREIARLRPLRKTRSGGGAAAAQPL